MKKQAQAVKRYWSLLSLVCIAILAAAAICYGMQGKASDWMHYFMGLIFCQFSLVKMFNLQGFADGFQMYDVIAKRSRVYALCYPFIELILGLLYLSFSMPMITYLITLVFMTVGVIGVVKALQAKLNVNCACMGSVLQVPLSTVTLTEDIAMGLMALLMLTFSAL